MNSFTQKSDETLDPLSPQIIIYPKQNELHQSLLHFCNLSILYLLTVTVGLHP